MIDQKAVGNLESGTDLEVDNPKPRTESGVDRPPEEHIESGVDLGVCIVLKVENLEVALQAETDYLGVAPQAVNNYLAPQAVTDYLAAQAITDYLGVSPQAVTN